MAFEQTVVARRKGKRHPIPDGMGPAPDPPLAGGARAAVDRSISAPSDSQCRTRQNPVARNLRDIGQVELMLDWLTMMERVSNACDWIIAPTVAPSRWERGMTDGRCSWRCCQPVRISQIPQAIDL